MSANINVCTIAGNVVKDSTMKNHVLTFSIASNSNTKNAKGEWEDYANFVPCAMFGKRAEALEKYLVKGQQVVISGALHQSRWEDKDGNPRSAISVYVNEIQLVGGKPKPKKSEPEEEIPF